MGKEERTVNGAAIAAEQEQTTTNNITDALVDAMHRALSKELGSAPQNPEERVDYYNTMINAIDTLRDDIAFRRSDALKQIQERREISWIVKRLVEKGKHALAGQLAQDVCMTVEECLKLSDSTTRTSKKNGESGNGGNGKYYSIAIDGVDRGSRKRQAFELMRVLTDARDAVLPGVKASAENFFRYVIPEEQFKKLAPGMTVEKEIRGHKIAITRIE